MATEMETLIRTWDYSYGRVVGQIESVRDAQGLEEFPGWRPAPGRAHAAWQWTHMAVTEEIIACDRIESRPAKNREWWDRFRGGSVPDDDTPSLDVILRLLRENHETMRETLLRIDPAELDTRTATMRDRIVPMREWIHILIWHLAHHQGQVHLTLNLFKKERGLLPA